MHCAVGQGQQRGGGSYTPFLYTASHLFVVHTFLVVYNQSLCHVPQSLGFVEGNFWRRTKFEQENVSRLGAFCKMRCDASCRVEHRPSPSGIIGRRIAPTSGRKEVEITHLRPGDGRSSERGRDGWAIRGQTTGYWICIPSILYNVNVNANLPEK